MASDQKANLYAYMTIEQRTKPKTNIELTISKFHEMITQGSGTVYWYLLLLYKHALLNMTKLRRSLHC